MVNAAGTLVFLRRFFLNVVFDRLQAFLGQVDRRVSGEGEVHQPAQLRLLLAAHDRSANVLKRNAVRRRSRLSVSVKIFEIIRHGEVEQRQTVIEDRRGSGKLTRMVIF